MPNYFSVISKELCDSALKVHRVHPLQCVNDPADDSIWIKKKKKILRIYTYIISAVALNSKPWCVWYPRKSDSPDLSRNWMMNWWIRPDWKCVCPNAAGSGDMMYCTNLTISGTTEVIWNNSTSCLITSVLGNTAVGANVYLKRQSRLIFIIVAQPKTTSTLIDEGIRSGRSFFAEYIFPTDAWLMRS